MPRGRPRGVKGLPPRPDRVLVGVSLDPATHNALATVAARLNRSKASLLAEVAPVVIARYALDSQEIQDE